MMIANLGFLTRILMVFHIKSTNQRLCNGLCLSFQFAHSLLKEKMTFHISLLSVLRVSEKILPALYLHKKRPLHNL